MLKISKFEKKFIVLKSFVSQYFLGSDFFLQLDLNLNLIWDTLYLFARFDAGIAHGNVVLLSKLDHCHYILTIHHQPL